MFYGSRFGKSGHSSYLAVGGILLVCATTTTLVEADSEPAIDLELAEGYFREALEASDRDGGKTWGQPLYGPTLFVDRGTRSIVANQRDARGELQERNGLFVGRLPDEVNCANTAIDWAGVRWTMLVWPLPEQPDARKRLMVHESFHRIQDGLGLPMSNPDNPQLDTRDGRIWLQLEWRALERALGAGGEERRTALRDALRFRAWRHRLFEEAPARERALELNEGLAEYTGIRVAYPAGRRAEQALLALREGPSRETFMRSFAYVSGPAYGLLLDDADPGWRGRLDRRSDLGALLATAWGIAVPSDTEEVVLQAAARYQGGSLIEAENERDRLRRTQAAEDRRLLLEGAILILSLSEEMRYSFNPGNLRALAGVGTVYPTLRVTDRWGVLEVDGAALMTRDDGRVAKLHVPAPRQPPGGQEIVGDGFRLSLSPGWSLEPADRIGDLRLRSGAD